DVDFEDSEMFADPEPPLSLDFSSSPESSHPPAALHPAPAPPARRISRPKLAAVAPATLHVPPSTGGTLPKPPPLPPRPPSPSPPGPGRNTPPRPPPRREPPGYPPARRQPTRHPPARREPTQRVTRRRLRPAFGRRALQHPLAPDLRPVRGGEKEGKRVDR